MSSIKGRLDQFKPMRRTDQQTRRRQRLEEQKRRRRRLFDLSRGIVVEENEGEQQPEVNPAMEAEEAPLPAQQPPPQQHPLAAPEAPQLQTQASQGSQHTAPADKKKNRDKDSAFAQQQLMLAEEMEAVPEDIEDAWSMVICPKGKRCLVVAARGVTKVFDRRGKPLFTLYSMLPGGGRRAGCHRESCVLDCVYDYSAQTFHVLDIIAWQGMNILDSEFEFRSFWLASKWQELPSLTQEGPGNEKPFLPLSRHTATAAVLSTALPAVDATVDGVVFFHRQSTYDPGLSPLALWVGRDRMEAILGVTPPPVDAMATADDE